MTVQPFVGRQHELDALLAAIDRTEGQLLLVVGDQGTGKSALLSELRGRLVRFPDERRRYLWFSRLASTDSVDEKLFELMDDLLHMDDLTRGKLVLGIPEERERWRSLLKAVPAIGQSLATLVRDDHRPVRSRFLETLTIVASHLQQEQRLVLLFDPGKYLHADYAAEWLHIAQELPERVTAVFAQRPDDVLNASDDLNTLSNVYHVPSRPLRFLSRSESDEFLRKFVNGNRELSHLGTPAKKPELDSLQAVFWERYQGYPLAMRIVADELDADPAHPLETLRQLPKRLEDLQQRQYNHVRDKVGADGLRLLKALAVQPFPVGVNVIGSILSLDRNDIEQLSARRELRVLLRVEANPALSLYHAIFEEFVQSQMDPVERRDYHNSSFTAYFNAHKANPNDNDLLVATAYHLEQSDLLAERPSEYAKLEHKIGNAFSRLPHVNRSANLANAIACYEEALRVYTERDCPLDWAATQNNLGLAYAELPTGGRSMNLTQAIACYEAALRVYTERDFPVQWALTQNNLGIAYGNLPTGDRGANLAKAISCYEAALRVYTERDFPVQWALTQNNLGIAYAELPTGGRSMNLQQAIAYFEAALRVQTEHDCPLDWAGTQNNLGLAYLKLPTGDRGANLAAAIACYKAALRVYTEHDCPLDWAGTQNNLGLAYAELPTGGRSMNLTQAIACYEAALRVYTERDFPVQWAETQNNLGAAYAELPTGDRGANLTQAIAYYEAALRVYTERDFPQGWAVTQNNLGLAYATLPTGDRGVNFQQAIACYEAALRVCTERDLPQDWAMMQNNLGAAYAELPTGDRGANLTQAIAYYEAALRVYTERDFPAQWAMIQNNLGAAYQNLPFGDRGANLAKAIACHEAALRGFKAAGISEEAGRVARLLAGLKEQ